MDPEELRVREETLRKLRTDPERYLAEYTSKFGNILNADDAATLFDGTRRRYRVAVHPAATLAAPQNYTETRRRLYELLDREYESGRITKEIYRRIRGRD